VTCVLRDLIFISGWLSFNISVEYSSEVRVIVQQLANVGQSGLREDSGQVFHIAAGEETV
jgi:hypothetical protein